ncbi:hypothetical protein [Sagittula sp. S175]|uniref:hypothetical protein n=1 Tax=Sagittula sp. S175 TaxID=3415129 RepID=UPI003C7D7DB1
MIYRVLAIVAALLCVETAAAAEGRFRMMVMGDFNSFFKDDRSFIDDAMALDSSGRLQSVDLNSSPGPETGPEIVALLAQDWDAAKSYFERRGDQQNWNNLEPAFDPELIARRVDFMREDGSTVRIYVFVANTDAGPIPRDCQTALIARDFAETSTLSAFTLESCKPLVS